MSHLFWRDIRRLNHIKHMFPEPCSIALVGDCSVRGDTNRVIHNRLRWRNVPSLHGRIERITIDGPVGRQWDPFTGPEAGGIL